MRENVFEAYRSEKKRKRIAIGMLGIAFVIVVTIIRIISRAGNDISVINALRPPQKIAAGTELNSYNREKVTCTIKYVLSYVMDYQENGIIGKGETKAIAYIATDDTLQKPFLVIVPADKQEKMEELYVNTDFMLNNDERYNPKLAVTLEGYVRYLEDEGKSYYKTCLDAIYGDGYTDTVVNVYYLDDENITYGNMSEIYIRCELGFAVLFCLVLIGVILSGLGNPASKELKRFIKEKGITKQVLNTEFQNAVKVAEGFYVSQEYTFCTNNIKDVVIENSEIIWAYMVKGNMQMGIVTYGICLFTIDGTGRNLIQSYKQNVEQILAFYQEKFPHIVIGTDAEKERLFKEDFERFLRLQYRAWENIPTGIF